MSRKRRARGPSARVHHLDRARCPGVVVTAGRTRSLSVRTGITADVLGPAGHTSRVRARVRARGETAAAATA